MARAEVTAPADGVFSGFPLTHSKERYMSTDEETKIFLGLILEKTSKHIANPNKLRLILFPVCNIYFFYILLKPGYGT